MLIGVARTSTIEQVAGLDAQVRQLKEYGCEKIYKNKYQALVSGTIKRSFRLSS